MQPTILYENTDFLVINKPAGLVVHGDGKHVEPTVMDWFLEHYPESKDVGEPMEIEFEGETIPVERSGIVHRIDRDTSGCLLLAKNQETFEYLKQQFQDHTIKKKYVAVVYGWIKNDRGIIDEPLGRSTSNIRAWTTKRGARGVLRPAITRYVIHKRFEYQGEKYTVVDLYPQTGRTHQLRVHMLYLGHPMVADPLYASSKDSLLPITRTALHAERVSLLDMNNKEIEITAPLPADLAKIVSL
jgi:23S rRNA pseudouridine1911/1915/1917 synthase